MKNNRFLKGVQYFVVIFVIAMAFPSSGSGAENEIVEGTEDRNDQVDPDALERWHGLSFKQKERLRRRHQRLQTLDPAQKERIKQRYNKFKSLPPHAKEKLRANWRRFKGLPEDQRKAIKEKYPADELKYYSEKDYITSSLPIFFAFSRISVCWRISFLSLVPVATMVPLTS